MMAQMVARLPLVQQVRGSILGGVVNFHLKIFNLGARRGGDVHMLRRRIVLLIAIRPSDGNVKPGGFHLLLSSSSHTPQYNYTNSYIYSHPNLNLL